MKPVVPSPLTKKQKLAILDGALDLIASGRTDYSCLAVESAANIIGIHRRRSEGWYVDITVSFIKKPLWSEAAHDGLLAYLSTMEFDDGIGTSQNARNHRLFWLCMLIQLVKDNQA